MIKDIPVRIIKKPSVKKLLPGLTASAAWQCDVYQTLILIGIITAPPRHSGFHLSTFWAWLRYTAAITKHGKKLKLRRAWTDVDPHQKTILADDFGMGFACHHLVDMYDFEGFADTRYVLDAVFGPNKAMIKVAKNGAAKSPDFIAIDSNDDLHILECKGSQTSITAVENAMNAGVGQKKNVKHRNAFASCMVGGIYVPLHGAKGNAELLYQDPEPDPRLEHLARQHLEEVRLAVRRLSFAKGLVAAGLLRAASAVVTGSVKDDDRKFVRELGKGELGFLGYANTTNAWIKTVEYRSFEPLSDESNAPAYDVAMQTKLTMTIPQSVVDLFRDAISGRGNVALDVIDTWLKNKRLARRSGAQSAVKNVVGDRTLIGSAWKGQRESDTSSSLETPEGIAFNLAQMRYSDASPTRAGRG